MPLTLHWVNPKADDLDHVIVVLNLKHQPRGKGDGTVLYSGLRPSAPFKLRAGSSGYVALFAVDRTGNASSAGPAHRLARVAHPPAPAHGQQGRGGARA